MPHAASTVSLDEEAYRAIRETILRGQLRPGSPLSRRRLAQELGMSVLPVTDALRRLEADGLVETRARAGTRVRVQTAVDIQDLYELREALESQSARLFAERATPAERRALASLARQVDSLFNRPVKESRRRIPLWRAQPARAVPYEHRGARAQSTVDAGDRTESRADLELAVRRRRAAHAVACRLSHASGRGAGLGRS
ncbi:MAG: GntR family transcriptional regulator, partial [Vicinamibacterales bacterium]